MRRAWDQMDLIQAGDFICEYTGVVLTREQGMWMVIH